MVSVRKAAAAGGANAGGNVAQRGQTPQSPLQQGPVIGGGSGGGGGGVVGGANSTNAMGNVTPTGSGNVVNSMLNTPPDPTIGFSFETRK